MRIALLAAAVMMSSPAWAFTKATTSEGKDLHWASSTVAVARDADSGSQTLSSEQIDRALRGALDTWSTVAEARVILTESPPRSAPKGDAIPTINLVRFRSSHWPYADNMLAYTQLYADAATGEILGGTIEFNEARFRFALEGEGALDPDTYDVQAVLTHELGHLLGLGHSTELGATMFASTAADDTHKRLLAADDRAGLAAIYDQALPPPTGCSLSLGSAPPSRGTLIGVVGLFGLLAIRRRIVVVRRRAFARRPRFVAFRPRTIP